LLLLCFHHGGSVGRMLSGGVVRDSNEAEYCLKTHVLIPIVEPRVEILKFDDQHVPNGLSE
jgi:hypothetical protein